MNSSERKKYQQEKILSAVAEGYSLTDAMKVSGVTISRATFYRWLSDENFALQYHQAKDARLNFFFKEYKSLIRIAEEEMKQDPKREDLAYRIYKLRLEPLKRAYASMGGGTFRYPPLKQTI